MNAYLHRRAMKKIHSNYEKDENDHWIWQGTDIYGIPLVSIRTKQTPVRRLLWQEVHGGPYPTRRIMLKCGVKMCVNPAHCGLPADVRKPRVPRPMRREIHAEIAALKGLDTTKRVGLYYNLHHSTVARIWRRCG